MLQRLPGEMIFKRQKSALLASCVISEDFVERLDEVYSRIRLRISYVLYISSLVMDG